MSFIRSLASERRTLLAASISLNKEIMSLCSYYIKKGLVCVTIIDLFGCQPFSYTKYTKLNTYTLCNMRSVSLNKYAFLYCVRYCAY